MIMISNKIVSGLTTEDVINFLKKAKYTSITRHSLMSKSNETCHNCFGDVIQPSPTYEIDVSIHVVSEKLPDVILGLTMEVEHVPKKRKTKKKSKVVKKKTIKRKK